jgi:tetratricopeptide (TPR) repeat protein
LALKEDHQEALGRLDKMIAVIADPYYQAIAFYFRAFFRYWTGDRGTALSDLDAAERLVIDFRIAPGLKANIQYLRGEVLLEGDDITAARRAIEKMVETINELGDNQSWAGRTELALAHVDLKAGQTDSARDRLGRAAAFSENIRSVTMRTLVKRRADLLSAEIGLKEGRFSTIAESFAPAAISEFMTLIQSSTTIVFLHLPPIQDARARALVGSGKIAEAIAEYEKLTSFDPREPLLIYPPFHFRLGKLYEQRGLPDKAAGEYRKFLGLWKNAEAGRPEVEDARARLKALL